MALAPLPENNRLENRFINQRIEGVLLELQNRQRELVKSKRQELKWKLFFLGACVLSLGMALMRTYVPENKWLEPSWLYLIPFIVDCFLFMELRRIQSKVHKALVNFGVVRHHLLGMIEVGLCQCESECDCKERLKRKALQELGVNLYV